MFTIIIPTWNNLPYLKLCIDSIRKYSNLDHEIIVHVNDGSDGTLDWVRSQGIRFSHSEKNVGVCISLNHLVSLASHDWVLFMNDDMVACPGWDTAFRQAIASTDTDLALFFATLIQPDNGKSAHIIKRDFGSSPADFDENRLIGEFMSVHKDDAEGVGSQPTLFHKKWWNIVGGYSLEFSPGMSSDDDLLMKYWVIGCRHFRVLGASRFYHFSCKSTGRIRHNKGGRIFAMKWGITQKEFFRDYLATLGRGSALRDRPSFFPRTTFRGRLRRAGYGLFHEYPLADIEAWDAAAGTGSWDDRAGKSAEQLAARQDGKQAWLILSHAFNMDGRAASQTITDKIPHLVDLGVEPIIVSGALGYKDPVLEHHQTLPALPVGLRFDLRHYLRNRISNHLLYRTALLGVTMLIFPFFLIEKLLIPIETSWSWSISAYLVSRRIIKNKRPTLVYSTGGAYAAHIAGYWLSKRFGIPWIAEIHDPMVIESNSRPTIREKFLMWLEEKICTQADMVWWFTEMAMERARNRHPQLAERGHCVIPGANAPAFANEPYQRGKHLVIAHFGSLSETRNLEIFLLALRRVIEKNPQWTEHIRLHLYGGEIDAVSARAMSDFPSPYMIEQFGRLETNPETGESGRDQVLRRMNAADCLLLLHGTVPFCEEYIPSKMYEYFWTQRPILALVWRNPQMTRMLRELGHRAVESDNVESIALALEDLHARWVRDDLANTPVQTPYTTAAAARQIATLVRESLKRRNGSMS